MAIGLNPQRNLFLFQLPADFVPREIELKYKDFIERNHSIFDSILDYLNQTIMGIEMPSLTFPTVEQTARYGKKIAFRGGQAPYDTISRDGRVRFKSIDSHMNYLIIQDILMFHYININSIFVNPFQILVLDKNNDVQFRYLLREVVMTSLVGREFGYEKTEQDFDTFDVTFKVNFIDWEYVPSIKQPILIHTKL